MGSFEMREHVTVGDSFVVVVVIFVKSLKTDSKTVRNVAKIKSLMKNL